VQNEEARWLIVFSAGFPIPTSLAIGAEPFFSASRVNILIVDDTPLKPGSPPSHARTGRATAFYRRSFMASFLLLDLRF
jgi:hypothetical protein